MKDRLAKRLDPEARYGLRLTLFGVALVLVAIPFGILVEQVLRSGRMTRLDLSAARSLHRHIHAGVAVNALQTISFLGKPIFLGVVVAVTATVLLVRGASTRLVTFVVVTPLGGGLVDTFVKLAVDRNRPDLPDPVATAAGKSFPSGHTMSSLVTYGVVALVFLPLVAPALRRLVFAATAALLVAIGVSRLGLGVHYLSDVLGGWLLGAAWLAGATAVFETWRLESGRSRAAPLSEGVEPEVAAAGNQSSSSTGRQRASTNE